MKVLGIDPGTRIVGYSVVEKVGSSLVAIAYGAIKTKTKETFPKRLAKIYKELSDIITSYSPDVVAIENVFYGKNIKSAIRIGEGRGVAILAAANADLSVYEYDPTKIKKSVVGAGKAHKTQVQSMVQAILNLREAPETFDASDALAIAICHHNCIPSL